MERQKGCPRLALRETANGKIGLRLREGTSSAISPIARTAPAVRDSPDYADCAEELEIDRIRKAMQQDPSDLTAGGSLHLNARKSARGHQAEDPIYFVSKLFAPSPGKARSYHLTASRTSSRAAW
jgi:hypothetical protein